MNENVNELDETLNSSAASVNSYDNYFTETTNGLDIEANNINANCITSKNEKFSLDSGGNLTVNSLTISDPNNDTLSFEAIFNRIYPVGAIYISTNDVNPATLFTGTWEKIENRFLLASGSSYTTGSTGGEATHTLTTNEMPSHNHKPSAHGNNWVPNEDLGRARLANSNSGTFYIPGGTSYDAWIWGGTSATGGNQPHNNMPPYLVVSIYKRVA